MFNYGGFKLFVFKLFSGIILILFSIILILSLITYNDADPGIGKFNSKAEINNFFGFAGAIISSFFFLILGASSFVLVLFIFYWLLIAASITIFKNWSYGIIFLLIAPLIAMINFRYWIILIKVKAKWNYKSASKKEAYDTIKEAFNRVQNKFS